MIKRCFSVKENGWLLMRLALWPHCSQEKHLSEMNAWCADTDRYAVFLARSDSGYAIGFAEASIRNDHVNGTETSPVGYLEGLYVDPAWRRHGVARELVGAVENWVVSAGCQELASDTDIENNSSQLMHKALGFKEAERAVFFHKKLI